VGDDLNMCDKLCMVAFTVIAFALMVAFALYVPAPRASKPTTPTAGGCPLDAVSYDAPVWMPECTRCQRVTDRITGRRWWLLTMSDGSHVVLPLDETEGK
jgi:hypothetical protein